jgi:putative hydrolase of the HAD superfamily
MRSVLFDYGGTLDSDGTTWLDRFYPIYKENGIDIERARFDRAFYDADDHLPGRFSLQGLDLEQTLRLQVGLVLEAIAPRQMDRTLPIAGQFARDCRNQFSRITPVLTRLSKRYHLGIVSNFYGNLEGILEKEGLREFFRVVADSGALGVSKPHPDIFHHAARVLKSAPAECVMVGDSIPRDIAGATAAGMKKALICAREQPPQAGQDWTVPSVIDLERALP